MSNYKKASSMKCKKLVETTNKKNIHKCSCKEEGTTFSYDNRFFECRTYGLFLRKHSEKEVQPLLNELHVLEKKSYEKNEINEKEIKSVLKKYDKKISLHKDTVTFINDYLMDESKNKDKFNLFQIVSSLENTIHILENEVKPVQEIKSMLRNWLESDMNQDMSLNSPESLPTESNNTIKNSSSSNNIETSQSVLSGEDKPMNLQPPKPMGLQPPKPMDLQPPKPMGLQPPKPMDLQPPKPMGLQPQIGVQKVNFPKFSIRPQQQNKQKNFMNQQFEKKIKDLLPSYKYHLEIILNKVKNDDAKNKLDKIILDFEDFEKVMSVYKNNILGSSSVLKNVLKLVSPIYIKLQALYEYIVSRKEDKASLHTIYFILLGNTIELEDINTPEEIYQFETIVLKVNENNTIKEKLEKVVELITKNDFNNETVMKNIKEIEELIKT